MNAARSRAMFFHLISDARGCRDRIVLGNRSCFVASGRQFGGDPETGEHRIVAATGFDDLLQAGERIFVTAGLGRFDGGNEPVA